MHGTWDLTIDSDMDPLLVPRRARLELVGNGAEPHGSMTGDFPLGEDVAISDVVIEDARVAWNVALRGMATHSQVLEFSGTVDGDRITGSVEIGIFGTVDFSGTPA